MSRNKTAGKVLSALILMFTHLSVAVAAQGAGYMQPHHGMPPQPHAPSWGAPSGQPVKLGIAFQRLSQQELDRRSLEYGLLIKRVMPGSVALCLRWCRMSNGGVKWPCPWMQRALRTNGSLQTRHEFRVFHCF